MKKITDIKSINLEKLSSGEYAQFMERVINLAKKATLEKLYIEEALITAIEQKLTLLTEIIGQSYTSQETKKLTDLDNERKKLVSFLLSAFRLERNSIDENRKEAATVLYNISKNQKSINKLPVNQKTQFINAMINDLSKPEYKPLVRTLGLTKTVEVLEATNQEYKQLSDGRAESQVANRLISFRELRKETNPLYRDLSKYAFAAHLLHESPETTNFVSLLNKLISDTIAANKQRLGQLASNKNIGGAEEVKKVVSKTGI